MATVHMCPHKSLLAFVLYCTIAIVPQKNGLAAGSEVDRYAYASAAEREVLEEADRQVSLGNCDIAWEMVWTLFVADNGNPNASEWLASKIVEEGLMPPGSSIDSISQSRHAFILATYSAPSMKVNDLLMVDLMHSLIPIHNRNFTRCLKNPDKPRQSCVTEAIKNRLVPDLETYAEEIATLAARSPEARCLPRAALLPYEALP